MLSQPQITVIYNQFPNKLLLWRNCICGQKALDLNILWINVYNVTNKITNLYYGVIPLRASWFFLIFILLTAKILGLKDHEQSHGKSAREKEGSGIWGSVFAEKTFCFCLKKLSWKLMQISYICNRDIFY